MSPLELQQSIYNSLKNLNNLDGLKKLFWSQLNYERVNKTLSRRGWSPRVGNELAEDPLLLASGGTDNAFQVIYARLKSERLARDSERLVVNNLLKDHPYALFVFSNHARSQWHFLSPSPSPSLSPSPSTERPRAPMNVYLRYSKASMPLNTYE